MSARDWDWERQLHGIVPPLISPLDDEGAPDAGAMTALVDHVIGGGCSGLQYKMDLVDGPANRDILVHSANVRVVASSMQRLTNGVDW
jgi:iron-sulfur cluster assembly protein